MQSQYDIACSIFFEHGFFTGGGLKALQVYPNSETKRVFRQAGIVMHAFPGGVHILYESVSSGTKKTRDAFLDEGWQLKFLLKNTDAYFLTYTAGLDDMDLCSSCLYFQNDQNSSTRKPGALHAGDFVGKETVRALDKTDAAFYPKLFGFITLQLHKGMEQNFSIAFSPASTYWCYVLMQEHLQTLSAPAIVSKNTPEVFSGPEQIRLPDNRPALAFFSPGPIVHKERPDMYYQLVEEYGVPSRRPRVVLPALPGPDKTHISFLKDVSTSKGRSYSYILI